MKKETTKKLLRKSKIDKSKELKTVVSEKDYELRTKLDLYKIGDFVKIEIKTDIGLSSVANIKITKVSKDKSDLMVIKEKIGMKCGKFLHQTITVEDNKEKNRIGTFDFVAPKMNTVWFEFEHKFEFNPTPYSTDKTPRSSEEIVKSLVKKLREDSAEFDSSIDKKR